VGEADAGELGERGQEVAGQREAGAVVLLEVGADPVAPVVERVPPAPQDPAVGGGPVVVELVARVREALAPPPADGVPLGGEVGEQPA
jgi:hypothetical protein